MKIKQGDLRPWVVGTLEQPLGVPIPLASATTVSVIIRQKGGTNALLLKKTCEILDAATGKVRYKWQPGETDIIGKYNVEFVIMWGTEPQTVPTEGYETVQILEDLDL